MDKEVFLNSGEQLADQRDWRAKDNEEGVFRGDILPIKRQVGDSHISLGLPSWMLDAYNALTLPRDVLNNYEPTIEDVNNFALTVGVGGIAGGASGAVPEGAIGTFSGGKPKHFTPLFPEKPVKSGAFEQIPYGEDMLGFTNFRSPVEDAVQNMDFPAKGSNILKDLRQNAPTIRKSELDTYPLDKIDPNKKYTKDDINSLFEPWGNPNVSGSNNIYSQYQRQSVADPEIDYAEFPIDYGTSEERGFKANSQHYNTDTLAHTRLSIRQPKEILTDPETLSDEEWKQWNKTGSVERSGEPYVLVEELQSDLMQKGYAPTSHPEDRALNLYNEGVELDKNLLSKEGYDAQDEHDYFEYLLLDSLKDYNIPIDEKKYNTLTDKWKTLVENDNVPFTSQTEFELSGAAEYRADNIILQMKTGAKPPINSTTEGVRLGILQAIAYAQQKGVNKIVLPPLDRILQAREYGHGIDFDQGMKPNSPFYATYINSTNKVLNQLQNELGDKIKIGPRQMNYKSTKPVNDPVVNDTNAPEGWGVISTEPDGHSDRFTNLGVEIDISGLGKLDASRPRFSKGGLVIGR